MGYMGSEEFIRLQFEEYLLGLLASVKYHHHLSHAPQSPLPDIDGDPAVDFSLDWLDAWQATPNYALFNRCTDSRLFDIVEPRHPTAGGLSINDINRRLALQIQELHLDERLATSREALNKRLATGQKKMSTAFNTLWTDIEARREAYRETQRQRLEEAQVAHSSSPTSLSSSSALASPSNFAASSSVSPSTPRYLDTAALRSRTPDLSHAQASVSAAGQKAGAYLSSWGAWASERSKKGWSGKTVNATGGGEVASEGIKLGTSGDNTQWGSSSRGNLTRSSSILAGTGEKTEAPPPTPTPASSSSSTLSPRKRRPNKEERGGDGIGRLDA